MVATAISWLLANACDHSLTSRLLVTMVALRS